MVYTTFTNLSLRCTRLRVSQLFWLGIYIRWKLDGWFVHSTPISTLRERTDDPTEMLALGLPCCSLKTKFLIQMKLDNIQFSTISSQQILDQETILHLMYRPKVISTYPNHELNQRSVQTKFSQMRDTRQLLYYFSTNYRNEKTKNIQILTETF